MFMRILSKGKGKSFNSALAPWGPISSPSRAAKHESECCGLILWNTLLKAKRAAVPEAIVTAPLIYGIAFSNFPTYATWVINGTVIKWIFLEPNPVKNAMTLTASSYFLFSLPIFEEKAADIRVNCGFQTLFVEILLRLKCIFSLALLFVLHWVFFDLINSSAESSFF